MCGRFGLPVPPKRITERFKLQSEIKFSPSYNIAPGMMVPIIVKSGTMIGQLARWGLIPSWAKDPGIGYRMINARAETVSTKASFRGPFASQRCLVPAAGFYEWKVFGKDKIPYYITLKSQDIFAFAGLYDTWKDPENRPIRTFTIITTEPNNVMAPIHNRMPVILSQLAESAWLDPAEKDPGALTKLLTPYSEDDMDAYPVSKLVNNPENDSPDVIKREEPMVLF